MTEIETLEYVADLAAQLADLVRTFAPDVAVDLDVAAQKACDLISLDEVA
ncbi:MAG: hypothetical protein ABUS48_07220 [Pseudomonadota bacterium]